MIDEAHHDPMDGEETERDSVCAQGFQTFIYLCMKSGIWFLITNTSGSSDQQLSTDIPKYQSVLSHLPESYLLQRSSLSPHSNEKSPPPSLPYQSNGQQPVQ